MALRRSRLSGLVIAAGLALVAIATPALVNSTEASWSAAENMNTRQQFAFMEFDKPTVKTKFDPTSGLISSLTVNFRLTKDAYTYFSLDDVEYSWGKDGHYGLPNGVTATIAKIADGSYNAIFNTNLAWGGALGTNNATYSLRFVKKNGWVSPWINVNCTYKSGILGGISNPQSTVTYESTI